MWVIEQCPFFFSQGRINFEFGHHKNISKNNNMAHVNLSWIWGNQFYPLQNKKNYSYES
jgi:hypothetical protein